MSTSWVYGVSREFGLPCVFVCVCANQDKTLRKLVAEFERAFKKLKEVAWQ